MFRSRERRGRGADPKDGPLEKEIFALCLAETWQKACEPLRDMRYI